MGYSEDFITGQDIYDLLDDSGSYFGGKNFNSFVYNGQTYKKQDVVVPSLMTYAFMINATAIGLYNRIEDIYLNRYYGFYGKDKRRNDAYKQLLDSTGFKDRLKRSILPAFYGTGGGDVIYYMKDGKVYNEPFIRSSRYRVQVLGDKNEREITPVSYEVLDSKGTVIEKLSRNDVYHLQYSSPDGNGLIGINPVITLTKALVLHWRAMAANETVYTNGLQAATLVSLDASRLGGMGADEVAFAQNRLRKQLAQGTNLRNRNGVLIVDFPVNFQNLQITNADMKTMELVEKLDKMVYSAYSVDPGAVDSSKSKYNNAEIARDSLYKSLQSKINYIAEAEMEFTMKKLDPKYDKYAYPLKIAIDPVQEDLEIKRLQQESFAVWFKSYTDMVKAGIPVRLTEEKKKELELSGFIVDFDENPAENTENTPENDNLEVEKAKIQEKVKENAIEENIKDKDPDVRAKDKKYNDYPESAVNNAKKVLEWKEMHGKEVKGGTRVGWKRANQIAKRTNFTEKTVRRIKAFFDRHEKNKKVAPEYKNEPWKDNGYVAWLLWGGDSMRSWANKKVNSMKRAYNQRRDFLQTTEIYESSVAYKNAENKLETAIRKQVEDNYRDIKKIQTFGLNKDGMYAMLKDLSQEAIDIYNEEYGSSLEYEEGSVLDDFVRLLVALSLFGYAGVDLTEYRDESVEMARQAFDNLTSYEGIDATTTRELKKKFEGRQPTQDELEQFIQDRKQTIKDGLFPLIMQVSLFESARKDGNGAIVAADTMRDGNVRETHIPNDRKYWRLSSGHAPWFDYNCRCMYRFFRTVAQAKAAGYTALKI